MAWLCKKLTFHMSCGFFNQKETGLHGSLSFFSKIYWNTSLLGLLHFPINSQIHFFELWKNLASFVYFCLFPSHYRLGKTVASPSQYLLSLKSDKPTKFAKHMLVTQCKVEYKTKKIGHIWSLHISLFTNVKTLVTLVTPVKLLHVSF